MSTQTNCPPLVRLGTRGSLLAMAQTNEVAARLRAAHPELAPEGAVEIVVIKTTGDRVQDRRLAEIGGKGLFTKEIEAALSAGEIDIAMHSMKDVPTWLPEGFEIAAVLPREDPRDAWFSRDGSGLMDLPAGSVVGTSAVRREAQVRHKRPDLEVVSIRGNVDTRLRKLEAGDVDATLLAVAGLKRLGREAEITHPLSVEEMLPSAAQGAVGLEVRSGDARAKAFAAALNHEPAALCVACERACLDVLDGSCRTPIAALAELDGQGGLALRALVAEIDGSRLWREQASGTAAAPEDLGRGLGQRLRDAAGEDFFAKLADP